MAPADPTSLARALRRMIWQGAYADVGRPAPTSLLIAPRYLTLKVLGDAVATEIVACFWAASLKQDSNLQPDREVADEFGDDW